MIATWWWWENEQTCKQGMIGTRQKVLSSIMPCLFSLKLADSSCYNLTGHNVWLKILWFWNKRGWNWLLSTRLQFGDRWHRKGHLWLIEKKHLERRFLWRGHLTKLNKIVCKNAMFFSLIVHSDKMYRCNTRKSILVNNAALSSENFKFNVWAVIGNVYFII